MKLRTRDFTAIMLAGIWVNASEFFRNQILLNADWVNHFQALGMIFPSAPLNALVWVIWGFVFATTIYVISKKFTLFETTMLCWVMAFLMMWLVTWNLNVLPLTILVYAIPLSLLESFVGSYICKKLPPKS
ncbi:MAG TPA: hypothetical protein PK299_13515 [Anaerolineales bacterium]|nr:hypothetical protein [Anaerolineales bacterium]